MELWDEQKEAIQSFLKHPAKSYLLQFETGLGKTEIAIDIIKQYNANNKRVIFFTHKIELRDQTFARFKRAGIDCGLIAAGKAFEAGKLCYIAMVQTASARLEKAEPGINAGSIAKDMIGDVNLVIFDECHRIGSTTWTDLQTQLYKDNANIRCLGLSATPIGTDGAGLYKNFDHLWQGMYLHEAINKGLLCKYRLFAPSEGSEYGIEYSKSREKNGKLQDARSDFTPKQIKEIDATFDRLRVYGNAVTEWKKVAENKKTLVFALSINAAVKLAKEFNEAGYDFRVFHSNMDAKNRIQWLQDFKDSKYHGIVNVGIFLEGTDCPDIECIVDVAPTRQLRVQRQKLGRGFRTAPGKEYLIIIDLANNCFFHGMPDDEVKYSLYGFNIPNRKSRSSDGAIHGAYITCLCCKLIFRKKEPVCPACGSQYNHGVIPEELPREIEERLSREYMERKAKEADALAKQTHFKNLYENYQKHNAELLKEKGLKASSMCLDDESLDYMRVNLWHDMQAVLKEVVETYAWQEMNLKLRDTVTIFYDFQFAGLVQTHILGYVTQDAFKICFRMILLNAIQSFVRCDSMYLLDNERIVK